MPGMAAFFKSQVIGEEEHVEKLVQFLEARRLPVEYRPIQNILLGSPMASPLNMIFAAEAAELGLEQFIWEQATNVEKDGMHDYRELLDFFIAEQVEEVGVVKRIAEDISYASPNNERSAAFYIIDRELLAKYG